MTFSVEKDFAGAGAGRILPLQLELELEQDQSFLSSSSWPSPAPSAAPALPKIGCSVICHDRHGQQLGAQQPVHGNIWLTVG